MDELDQVKKMLLNPKFWNSVLENFKDDGESYSFPMEVAAAELGYFEPGTFPIISATRFMLTNVEIANLAFECMCNMLAYNVSDENPTDNDNKILISLLDELIKANSKSALEGIAHSVVKPSTHYSLLMLCVKYIKSSAKQKISNLVFSKY
jgi:hypothetical protein